MIPPRIRCSSTILQQRHPPIKYPYQDENPHVWYAPIELPLHRKQQKINMVTGEKYQPIIIILFKIQRENMKETYLKMTVGVLKSLIVKCCQPDMIEFILLKTHAKTIQNILTSMNIQVPVALTQLLDLIKICFLNQSSTVTL